MPERHEKPLTHYRTPGPPYGQKSHRSDYGRAKKIAHARPLDLSERRQMVRINSWQKQARELPLTAALSPANLRPT